MSDLKITFQELPSRFQQGTIIPVPELPPRLLLDLKSDCNLKCPMCIVHGDPNNHQIKDIIGKTMGIDNARKILDEVMSVKPTVGPSLWSEPLMNKDIIVHFKDMKDRGVNVSINTNGLLLNKKMAAALVEFKVDSLSISIDAVTPETLQKIRGINKLDKIEFNVHQALLIRGDSSLPRIGVSFTKQAENLHELDAFIKKWVNIVDFVRVGEVFENGSFSDIEIDKSKRKPCPELFNTMAVHTNGEVSICCLDGFKEYSVGNVLRDGVKNVWLGDDFQNIRSLHEQGKWDQIPLCKNCDRWASDDYQEYIDGSVLVRKSSEHTFYNRLDKLSNWKSERTK